MPTEPPDGEKIAVFDPDDVAIHVECRAARIARVDGSIDLQEVVIGSSANVASARGHDARRHGAAEAERIADCEHPVADPGALSASLTWEKSLRPSTLIKAMSVRELVPITLAL